MNHLIFIIPFTLLALMNLYLIINYIRYELKYKIRLSYIEKMLLILNFKIWQQNTKPSFKHGDTIKYNCYEDMNFSYSGTIIGNAFTRNNKHRYYYHINYFDTKYHYTKIVREDLLVLKSNKT